MKKFLMGFAAALLMFTPGTASAQAPQPPQDQQAPAEIQPGVARVSLIHGDVSTQRGDSGDWVVVTLNTPVVVGDNVATGKRSRAEVQLDYANILRMSDEATAKIAGLTRTKIQVQIGQGLVTYSILKGSEADVEIDTPNVAVRPQGEGDYRILVNNDAETQVIVRKGSAEVSTPQGSTRLEKGQQITIQGTDNPQYQTASAPSKDDWDDWNNERNRTISNAESWKHTDRYYVGADDLDAYGRWSTVPDYGPVWIPAGGPGWAPYRDGRWVWEPYYGWTWVSYEPWGWAPYHYGRWMVYGGNWCWWPGPVGGYRRYRPIWAPAYVSFFGFGGGGGGFGFGFGFGNVGWLPIGPCDYFHPWYGRHGNRVTVVNVTNINVRNFSRGGLHPIAPLAGNRRHVYSNLGSAASNARIRGGLTTMPANEFGRGRVPSQQRPIDRASFRQASMMTGAVPVTPTRESLRSIDRQVNSGAVPNRSLTTQRFFTRSQPGPAPRSFNEQAAQVQHAMENSRRAVGTVGPSSRATGSSGLGPHATAAATPQSTARPGWHSFGSGNPRGSAAQNSGAPMGVTRPGQSPRTPQNFNRIERTIAPPAPRQTQSGAQGPKGGWQHFNPSPHWSPGAGGSETIQPRSGPSDRGFPQRQMQLPPPRGGGQAYSRPPLDLRQPIVRPRSSSPSESGGSRGGSRGGSSGGRGSSGAPPHSSSRSSGGGRPHR